MKKNKFLLFLILLCQSSLLFAAEEGDSLAIDLGEIVVEGRSQRVISNGVEYIPGKKMKKMALDATSLLSRMQIPQLNVNPADKSVKTISNADVTFFINNLPASSGDLAGLLPEEVLSVEVLDHPTDPRFGGAEHVVNFLLRRYEWGGYTKLTLNGQTLGQDAVTGRIYEKFNFKKWTLDANVSANGTWNRKSESFFSETFRDFMYDSQKIDFLERYKSTDYTNRRNNSQGASLQASYNNEKGTVIRHTVSYSRSDVPKDKSAGGIRFSLPILPSSEFMQDNTNSSDNASASGYYQFLLPRQNSLIANWAFSYSANKRLSSYALGDLAPICNDILEKAYVPNVSLFYSKQLPYGNTIRAYAANYTSIYDTRYTGGSSLNQKLISSESLLFMEYMKNFGFGLNIHARVGLSHLFARLNGETYTKELNPRLALMANYYINSRNRLSFDINWNNSSPQSSWMNDATVRQDELMWIKGNPDMGIIYGPTTGLTYSFVPLNIFSMSADLRYSEFRHMPVYVYGVEQGLDGIVRGFSDDNTARVLSAKVSATVKLLGNSLIMNVAGGFTRQLMSGIRPANMSVFSGQANASYYAGPVGMTLYYFTPQKSLDWNMGAVSRTKCRYGLIVSCSAGNLKAEASFGNWFSKGKAYEYFNSDVYSSAGWTWSQGSARSLELTLTYTFSYGKKLNRNDEIGNGASTNSAILE